MLRPMTCLIALALTAASPATAKGPASSAEGTVFAAHPSTYSSTRGTSAQSCEETCKRDSQCTSWQLTPPTFRIGPRCELQRGPVTNRTSAPPTPIPARPAMPPEPVAAAPVSIPQADPRPAPSPARAPAPAPALAPSVDLRGGPEKPLSRAPQPVAKERPVPAVSPAPSPQMAAPVPAAARPAGMSAARLPEITKRSELPAVSQPSPAPPPMIARPQAAPVAEPALSGPAPVQSKPLPPIARLSGNSSGEPRPALAPRPAIGQDERPPLPRRKLGDNPTYSVQSIELVPGDFDSAPEAQNDVAPSSEGDEY